MKVKNLSYNTVEIFTPTNQP